jgi:autotransporter translocation and assembly factor TamB
MSLILAGSISLNSTYKKPPKRSTGGLNFDIPLSISIPNFDTIEISMKYNKNNLFKCIIFIRLILDTTFLL